MKCELCHKADAETAIRSGEGDGTDELYVCHACAKLERRRRLLNSQLTRKMTEMPPGVSMSITGITSDGEQVPPPVLDALMDAFHDMVSDLEKVSKKVEDNDEKTENAFKDLPLGRVAMAYRFGEYLHLEGLNMLGELGAIKRALHALDMRLVGVDADGVQEVGHIYTLQFSKSPDRAKRVLRDLVKSEREARICLCGTMPRVGTDAFCRALALLKNCRLLSEGEYFDLLSPLRIAAADNLLDGITLQEIERLMKGLMLTDVESNLSREDRDRQEAEKADEANRRFENVMLNELAEGDFR